MQPKPKVLVHVAIAMLIALQGLEMWLRACVPAHMQFLFHADQVILIG